MCASYMFMRVHVCACMCMSDAVFKHMRYKLQIIMMKYYQSGGIRSGECCLLFLVYRDSLLIKVKQLLFV